jgi:uncharacterized UBP type Zn finger protein
MNTQRAMDWLLEHEGDQDIDTPLTPEDLQSIAKVQASIVPDTMVSVTVW